MSDLRGLLARLWREQRGSLLSTEYIILGTLLTLGLIVGISAAQTSLLSELEDYASAILSIGNGTPLADDGSVTFDGSEKGTFTP